MDGTEQSFREFERAGWESEEITAKYHEDLSGVTTQSISALLDDAGVAGASKVLDVATGAGYIAGAAAARGADAVGIDFSAAQVGMARAGFPGLRFEQADAESLPFGPDIFDAVVSGFGMCHLPDPDAALREAFRVLKPGGRVAFTVWDQPERAVGFGSLYDAVRAHGSMDVGLPVGPSFFLFSDPEQSRRALLEAGFASPSVRQVPQVWRVPGPDYLFEAVTEGTVRAGATVRAQSPQAKQAIRAALGDLLAPYRVGDAYDVPMPAVVAAALKP